MSLWDRIRANILENLLAWFLVAVIAYVWLESYRRGQDLQKICEATGEHVLGVNHPQTDQQIIDSICVERMDQ